MTENDLTIQILQGIRSDLQQASRENAARFEAIDRRFEAMNDRFEAIETALKDMAEQLVLQSGAIRFAIEVRANVDSRLDDREARLARLEARIGS